MAIDLRIDRVVDYGTHTSERVEITVLRNCNLVDYILSDTTYTGENTISNAVRHTHWFKNKNVIQGDQIVLYTKPWIRGLATTEQLPDNKTRHVIYWGLDSFVWNNDGDCAVLFKISNYSTYRVQ